MARLFASRPDRPSGLSYLARGLKARPACLLRDPGLRIGVLAAATVALLHIASCSAPGPVLPDTSGKAFADPALYSMEPTSHRFKENVAARLKTDEDGISHLWQLSIPSSGGIRLLRWSGRTYRAGERGLEFRPEKCYIFGQDGPEDRTVPLEVFQCDHIVVNYYFDSACDCLLAGPPAELSEDLVAPSKHLYGLRLRKLPPERFVGQKVNAFSNDTEAWYWGLMQEGRSVSEGSGSGNVTVRQVVDGFIFVEGQDLPDTLSIPLKAATTDLF